MPLKLQDPRPGKTPYYSIRGTYLGVHVDTSCRTDRRHVAAEQLKQLREAIERGDYPPRAEAGGEQPTFLSAAVAYMEAGRSPRYVAKLIRHFGETLLSEIDQAAIDAAAVALYPNVVPATRNVCVYTPVSAILHHAGVEIGLRRPKGAKGRVVTDWLTKSDASAIVRAAEAIDREYAVLLRFLVYTGVRLGEALRLDWSDLSLEEGSAWMRRSKEGVDGGIRLRPDLREALLAHRETCPRRRVFRFQQGGHLKHLLTRAKLAALGLPCPTRRPKGWKTPPNRLDWVNHHSFRHTWATWMRQAGADVQGLVATGNWRDPKSAARYAHVVPREEWARVDALPTIGGESAEKARDAG